MPDLSAPAVWGPLLICLTVYLAGTALVREITAAADRAARDRKRLLEALEEANTQLHALRLSADMIESNTHPPSEGGDWD